MVRSILTVILLLSVSVIGFGQQPVSNPGPNGQVWMEYPTGPIYPPNIVSDAPFFDRIMK